MRLFRSVFVIAIALTGLTTGAAQASCTGASTRHVQYLLAVS